MSSRTTREGEISRLFEKIVEIPGGKEALDSIFQIPEAERPDTLLQLSKTCRELSKVMRCPVDPLPQPGDDYPRYIDNETSGEAYDFLKEHWGSWLPHFNKDFDTYDLETRIEQGLYLDRLKSQSGEGLDPTLKDALYAQRRSIRTEHNVEINDIVPKKSARIDLELELSKRNPEELNNAVRLYFSPKLRKSRLENPSPS